MDALLGFLVILNIIFLGISIFKPTLINRLVKRDISRKYQIAVNLAVLFLLVILCGVFVPSKSLSENTSKEKQSTSSASTQKQTQNNQTSGSSSVALGAQTKTSGCVAVNSLPDKACTPGAIFATATKDQICVSGYSSSVRSVSESTKETVYREYGITSHTTGQYEVDHLISLELGGSNDISNLWPEAASPVPGFHQKDTVENKLHSEVCNGTMSLSTAQIGIAGNWLQFYVGSSSTTNSTTPVTPPPVVQSTPQPSQVTNPGNGHTALCNDGTYSDAAHHQGACSHHSGVAVFYK
jgi:hypothetical protein